MKCQQKNEEPYKTKLKPFYCPICGQEGGCRPIGGKLRDNLELTAEEWNDLYWFIRCVQLPFIHRLILRARKRVEDGQAPDYVMQTLDNAPESGYNVDTRAEMDARST